MKMIEPKRLSKEQIWESAENFRNIYVKPNFLVPVPIERIVEINLRISVFPKYGLRSMADIDGFISKDLKTLFIDSEIYSDQRFDNRIRFTFAHELGHYVLHREEITECRFDSEQEWYQFRTEMLEENISWFEWQANEFAGRLLVPKNVLIEKLSSYKPKIKLYLEKFNDRDMLLDYLSNALCKDFEVSGDVLKKRINNENLSELIFQ